MFTFGNSFKNTFTAFTLRHYRVKDKGEVFWYFLLSLCPEGLYFSGTYFLEESTQNTFLERKKKEQEKKLKPAEEF